MHWIDSWPFDKTWKPGWIDSTWVNRFNGRAMNLEWIFIMTPSRARKSFSKASPFFFLLGPGRFRRGEIQCRSIISLGTYSQSFAPNCLRGEQIGALFNSHSFCTVVVDVESLEDLCGRKKGQLCSAIAFGSSLGALQRRIHENLTRSQQEQRVFEETFTDWFWRLVRHVEDSLNSAGLLASTTLLLMPAWKAMADRYSAYKHPQIK